jgi:phytoene/squalene synthetase
MELDLNKKQYDKTAYSQYIYGSAETVGLMCLYIFCEGNQNLYDRIKRLRTKSRSSISESKFS